MFIDIMIGGIASGSIYAMLAVAVVIILKTTGIANFAQGEMAMFSTFLTYSMLVLYEVPYLLALILTILFAALMGIFVQQIIIRPLLSSPVLSTLIATLGLNLIIHSVAGMIWGYQTNIMPSLFEGLGSITLGGIVFPIDNLILILIPVILLCTFICLLKFSRWGIALKATSENKDVASLMGINVNLVYYIPWIYGSIVGAIAGILIAPIIFLDINLLGSVLIKAFSGAVLGAFL